MLVVGLHDCQTKKTGFIDGNGGKRVRDFLLSASHSLIGANLAYDLGWLCYEHNLKVKETQCGLIDVQVAESFIDEYQSFDLESLAIKYLNEKKGSGNLPNLALQNGFKGDFRKHLGKLWDLGHKDEIRKYVVSDADQPARIWEQQKKILEEQGLMPAFELNMKVLKVCVKARQRGIRIDKERWEENCEAVKPIHDKLEKQFFKKWGEVNINSPKQMGEFMRGHNVPFRMRITVRGWEPEGRKWKKKDDAFTGEAIWEQRKRLKESFPAIRVEKNKIVLYVDEQYTQRTCNTLINMGYNITANPNIDKYFFKDYKGTYPVVADCVEYKTVKGIISKFLGPKFERFLVWHEAEKEWRLHGEIQVVGARQTGRTSSKAPNLQNIPSKTKLFEGTEHEVDLSVMCREIFLPEKGHIFVKLDFSGQENRLQAHFAIGRSGARIRKMYNDNPRLDEHQFVANESGLEAEFGHKTGRKYAKNVRFGLSYGMQIFRMCLQFGWEKEFAEDLKVKVEDASPWFKDTMEEVQKTVAERGYIKTLLLRRIHLRAGDRSKLYPFYNYLIQGSAADQMKACIVAIDDTESVEILLLIVHDEGDFSLPMNAEGYKRLLELKHLMETTIKLDVPVICDPELGLNWAYMEGQQTNDKGEPIEAIDKFWKRMVDLVKKGKRSKVRIWDMETMDDEEDEEEEAEDDD
jgi:DNA polymerase I-like protein with 3'-5' exonuclease and polymerase domains